MFTSSAFRLVLVLFFSLSANAETVRGAQRELLPLAGVVQIAVNLRSAANYAILAITGISTVPQSAITGDIGVSPIAATAMTGFSLVLNSLDATAPFSKSTQFTGRAYAASYAGRVAPLLTTAVSDMLTAYNNAADRTNTETARMNFGVEGGGVLGVIAGATANPLTAGLSTFDGDVDITNDIYFSGTASDIFIIQIAGNLKQVAGKQVILGTVLAKNIYWQVAGRVELMEGAKMEGILLVKNDVLFKTGSSLNGRVLAQTACNLQMATIVQPADTVSADTILNPPS
jgi:hypothetical protein